MKIISILTQNELFYDKSCKNGPVGSTREANKTKFNPFDIIKVA